MRILFKYPSRARPELFKEVVADYNSHIESNNFRWVVSLDADDETMNNKDMIVFMQQNNMQYFFGKNSTKIEAINADMENQDYDILFLVSDDMRPKVFGFDNIIREDMEKHFPDFSGGLFYNDGLVGERLCTLNIMGRGLYERFGYIYHPEYKSVWCDNEYTDVAKSWGKLEYIDRVIVKHEWIGLSADALHHRNERYRLKDRRTYKRRKRANFPKELVQVRRHKDISKLKRTRNENT